MRRLWRRLRGRCPATGGDHDWTPWKTIEGPWWFLEGYSYVESRDCRACGRHAAR